MKRNSALGSLVVISFMIFFYIPAFSASTDPCCPLNEELTYLLQPPSDAAAVEDDFKAGRHFLAIKTHHERVGAGVCPPVDVTDVVTRHVFAVVLELERGADTPAQQLPAAARERIARDIQRVTLA